MAEVIRMPKMSDTMTEGVIVEWHKKVGDAVKSGDILAEVETDKATMELENYVKGTLLYIGIEKGKAVPVDAVIAIIGQSGEDISNLLTASSPTSTPTLKPKKDNSEQPNPGPVSHLVDLGGNANESRVKASPLARRMAEEKGINLTQISGSGDAGRIVKRDIEQVNSSETPLMKSNEQDQSWDIPLSQMRKTIARRLSESKFSAPHFYLTMEINMDQAIAARQRINQAGIFKISLNDMVVQASARALRKHPKVNVSWMGDVLRQHQHIHVGVAMAIEDGLVVPVIRNTDRLGLSDISTQIKMLAEKAKAKKLQPEDFTGNTFTISNLGMYGIEEFTAIINPPDACILAVGTVKEIVVSKKGQFQTTQVMKVTLSCDHRAVDGAVGASFLQTLKNNLEDPFQMLI